MVSEDTQYLAYSILLTGTAILFVIWHALDELGLSDSAALAWFFAILWALAALTHSSVVRPRLKRLVARLNGLGGGTGDAI